MSLAFLLPAGFAALALYAGYQALSMSTIVSG